MPIDHKPTKILADSYFRRLLICKKKKNMNLLSFFFLSTHRAQLICIKGDESINFL